MSGHKPGDLLGILAGEWEITCEETSAVWGDAVVNGLKEGLLLKREPGAIEYQVQERIPCTFEDSGTVKLQWGRKGARVSATLVEHCSEWLRWRLKPHSNGQARGCALWRRKPEQGIVDVHQISASQQDAPCVSKGVMEEAPSCEQPLKDVTNTQQSAAGDPRKSIEATEQVLVAVVATKLEEEARRSWQRVQLKALKSGEMQWQTSSGSEPRERSPSPPMTPRRKKARPRTPSPKTPPQTPIPSPKTRPRTPSPCPPNTPSRIAKKARSQRRALVY